MERPAQAPDMTRTKNSGVRLLSPKLKHYRLQLHCRSYRHMLRARLCSINLETSGWLTQFKRHLQGHWNRHHRLDARGAFPGWLPKLLRSIEISDFQILSGHHVDAVDIRAQDHLPGLLFLNRIEFIFNIYFSSDRILAVALDLVIAEFSEAAEASIQEHDSAQSVSAVNRVAVDMTISETTEISEVEESIDSTTGTEAEVEDVSVDDSIEVSRVALSALPIERTRQTVAAMMIVATKIAIVAGPKKIPSGSLIWARWRKCSRRPAKRSWTTSWSEIKILLRSLVGNSLRRFSDLCIKSYNRF